MLPVNEYLSLFIDTPQVIKGKVLQDEAVHFSNPPLTLYSQILSVILVVDKYSPSNQ